ncbi:patatin-like phospholipase family protein [Apibacter sp. HY039]|uniref:patatin-like phospholipase family protein n=1 Tax=Apibacter sp. HY039 TaxID=2501476 RepID=UPI000FEB8BD3|nr:patatin-like phospholipase family protein [Apibacter sp. HY039]
MNYCKKYFFFFILTYFTSNIAIAQSLVTNKKQPKVGLVLSGGGAKGFAHVEVIEAIEKAGIKIDYISGTSMGAIVGALYASGYSPDEIKKAIGNVDFMELFLQEKDRNFIPFFDKSYREKYILTLPINNFKLSLPSAISKGQGPLLLLTDLLSHVHQINDYSKLPIPFLCIATNLETGDEEQIESGFLPLSVLASGAYPSLIEPVKIDNKVLIDGGIVNNFPARALKNKGMDIVIGVDLGAGLQKSEDINSILSIINQIISYRINIKTDFERSYVDLIIKPDLKNYTVTDFDKKDSILYKGKLAAEKVYPQLVDIAKAQGYDTLNRPRVKELPYNRHLFITQFNVQGTKSMDSVFVKRKMGIQIPQNTTVIKLDKGVSSLYSTGNFNRVYYQIKNDSANESQKLTLHLDEKKNNSVRFGLHYDDVYKASLLTNITLNKLLLNNSTISLDVIFSNNFRTNLNYFIDNGIYPSIGSNTSFNVFNFNFSEVKENLYKLKRLRNFNQQIYFQSTLVEKYAIGAGMEYNYTTFSPYGDLEKKDGSYFLSPYFFLKADTRDNANFPFRGFKLDASAKHVILSNSENDKFTMIKGDISYSIPIGKRFAIENQGFYGVSFETPALQYKYFLGGYFEQELTNFKKFLGLPFAYTNGNQIISFYSSLNYRILKNHYVKTYVNFANVENNFKDLKYFDYKYSSYGLGYGYDSPFGPINLMYTYSVNQKKGVFSVGLGYWF